MTCVKIFFQVVKHVESNHTFFFNNIIPIRRNIYTDHSILRQFILNIYYIVPYILTSQKMYETPISTPHPRRSCTVPVKISLRYDPRIVQNFPSLNHGVTTRDQRLGITVVADVIIVFLRSFRFLDLLHLLHSTEPDEPLIVYEHRIRNLMPQIVIRKRLHP